MRRIAAQAFLAAALLVFASRAHATQIITLADVDQSQSTGCSLYGVPGVDVVGTTNIENTGAGLFVTSVTTQPCTVSLGAPTNLPAGWPVPQDGSGVHVESLVPYSALGITRTTHARYAFVLLRDGAAPILVPANGSTITFGADTQRRRVAPPAGGGIPASADGRLDDWQAYESMYSDAGAALWMRAGSDALVFRFDVKSTGAPVAVDDDYVAPAGGTLNAGPRGVLSNDTDPDGDPLTAELVAPATHGTVTLSPDGSFAYQHDGSTGIDTFTYRASDGFATSDAATVRITPVPANAPPAGAADSYSVLEDNTLTIAAPGVLANDSDPESDPMTAVVAVPPSSGTLTLQADGSFVYVPAPNFSGTVAFTYRTSDGQNQSAPVTVTLTVNPVNDAPSFTAGANVTVAEDSGAFSTAWASAITAGPLESSQALSFQVTGNSNPGLFSAAPAISSAGVLTFTPAADANGVATITVQLHDDGGVANGGVDTSGAVSFTITVNAVNDAPTFALPASAPSVIEDAGAQTVAGFATSVFAGPADEAGQSLTFNVTAAASDATLTFTSAPAIAADGTLSYTLAANAYGTATFNVVLTDNGSGTAPNVNTSVTKQFMITVTPVNDAPSFTIAANPPASNEDGGAQTAANFATALSQGPNETGQTLTFVLTPVSSTGNLTFAAAPAINAAGVLTYTASADTNGTATFSAVLTDDAGTANGGVDTSAAATFTITVTAVNDAPTFNVPASAPVVNEDAGSQTVAGFATAISAGPADESGQTLTFSVTQASSDATLTFTTAPALAADGTLNYTPAADAYGTATFNVVLMDNGSNAAPNVNTSVTKQFTITVTAVNDAPSFVIAGNPAASIEDGGAQTVSNFATSISQGANETGQTLTFAVSPVSSTGTLSFATAPAIAADGTLTYTAAPDTNGTATFSVVLSDNGGGTNTSGAQTFTITVTAVNDAPTFTVPASAPAVTEDSGAQSVTGFATAISAGAADESSQTLTFTVTQSSSDATLTFTSAPAIAADGTLAYTAAPDAYGTATFNVVLTDNGSNVPPDVNTSVTKQFTITVTAVNDVPSFTIAANPPASIEDGGAQNIASFATSISAGANEPGQTLTFSVTPASSTGTLAFASGPSIDATGALTYTAAPNTNGTATFDVVLSDDGGGTNTSATQSFTITVTAVNDAPTFTLPATAPAVNEDSGAQTVPAFATAMSAGPADESAQTLTFSVVQVSSDATLTFSAAPSIAADGTLTYTASADAYGTATFNVVLTDSGSNVPPDSNTSAAQQFTVTINPLNDAPSFTIASNPPASNEDAGLQTVNSFATGISQGPNETGQTLTFTVTPVSSTGTLTFTTAPAIDAAGVLTYTAAPDTNGTATFSVVLADDAGGVSGAQTFTITVNAVNDAPTFVLPASAPSISEDAGAQSVGSFATSMSAGPADESGQTLTFSVTQTSADATLTFTAAPAIAADGTLTYTAAADAYGTATFNVVLVDNGSNVPPNANTSVTKQFTITVNAINDAPSFTIAGDPAASNEDGGLQTVSSFATSISQGPNETGQTLTFNVTPVSSTGTLTFTTAPAIDATGVLTYTAAPDTNGTATFSVTLSDNAGGVSGAQTFTITVNAVNDAPTFTLPASAPSSDEDNGAQSVASFATAMSAGPADESGQTLTFSVTQSSIDPTLAFTAAPAIAANGTLTYTAAPNAYGTATFDVVLTDGGSNVPPNTNTSSTRQFTITVNPVNDLPSFTIAADPAASNEDGGLQTVNAFATSISAGPGESGQTLTFTVTPVSSTGTLAFSSAPAIDASGVLTYTAAPDTNGTATFSVTLADDAGGTTSAQTFTITVNAVNDAPTFTLPASAPPSLEDGGAQTVTSFVTAASAGPSDEAGQTLTFAVVQSAIDPTLSFTAAPAIAPNGTLTYTASPNAFGTATFNVTATDNGSSVAPNVNTSVTKQFTITVTAVNDAPVALNDSYSYPTGGSPLTVAAPGVLANDSDIDGNPLTATLVSPPAEGTLSLQPDGSFTYTKAASPTMTSVTFTYVAVDPSTAQSNTATVTIAINAPPVAANDSYTMLEDVLYSESAPGLLANDSDPDNNIVMVQPVSGPDCAGYASGMCGTLSLSLMQDGSFFYQPPVDFNGTVTFTYKLVDDGGLESSPATVTLTVTPVNDQPTFDVQTVSFSGPQNNATVVATPFATNIKPGPTTATDEASQTLNFETEITYTNGTNVLKTPLVIDIGNTTVVSQNGIYVDSAGTLYFQPGTGTGYVLFSVRLKDNGGTDNGGVDTSETVDSIKITSTPVVVNKAPTFNIATPAAVNEDSGAKSISNFISSLSPGAGESSQTVTSLTITGNTNPSLFSAGPALVWSTGSSAATLTYTPAPNAYGTATLTVTAVDNGGTANGGVNTTSKTSTITINNVNDAPSFVKGSDLSYASGTTGAQSVTNWATSISAGPNEAAQTLTFIVTLRGATTIFSGTPTIDATTGTLSFTLAGSTGLAYVDVKLKDNGGTANGGVDTSAIQTFTVNAGSVNSPPSFVKGSDITVLEDSGVSTTPNWATAISAPEGGQTVSFIATAATPALFSVQPAISSTGTLTFTPAANAFGATTVTVTAKDDGGTAGGGVDTSDPQTFTITITGVNDAPTLNIPSPSVAGGENGGLRTIAGFAIASAGPNETGQTFTYTVVQTGGSVTLFDSATGGVAPAISPTGTLTFTTALNQNGSATFSVTVKDSGGTANGGADTSTALPFTITISTGGPTVPGTGITFQAYANIPLTVGAVPAESSYNLLDGASDPDTPLSVLVTSKPANSRVDVAADGSFTFRSGDLAYASGAVQPQSFKWRVCDSLGNCSAERTATVNFTGPLVFFIDAAGAVSPGLYTLDVPGKSVPAGFTTSAAPAAKYIIKSGTYQMGTTGNTTQLAIRAGDFVYGQGLAGLTLSSLGISPLAVGTLPTLPDYSTGTTPTLNMPDPTYTAPGGGITITQSPFFKGYGGGTVKNLRFTKATERVASWILFSNSSWTSAAGNYVFENITCVNGQSFAIPQVGSSITVKDSNLTISEGFGMNGGTITVTNTPIKLTSTDTSSNSYLFNDFDSTTSGTINATIDANSPITIANNVGYLFPVNLNPAFMPTGSFTINSSITITRTSSTTGLYIKDMANVTLNGAVTVTTATGKPVQLVNLTNFSMPHASNTAKMTSTPASTLIAGISMQNVAASNGGINLVNIDVRKGGLSFSSTSGDPITITNGTVVGDLINPCLTLSSAPNVTITGVTYSNCGP